MVENKRHGAYIIVAAACFFVESNGKAKTKVNSNYYFNNLTLYTLSGRIISKMFFKLIVYTKRNRFKVTSESSWKDLFFQAYR